MANNTTTNMSLQKPVDEHAIETDFSNLQASHEANMDILELSLSGYTTIGTNASIVATAASRIVKLYACSAGSISTISGALTNVPFTMMMMSSGASLALLSANTKYILSADWIPNTQYSSITLVWDGTRYIEIARVTAA